MSIVITKDLLLEKLLFFRMAGGKSICVMCVLKSGKLGMLHLIDFSFNDSVIISVSEGMLRQINGSPLNNFKEHNMIIDIPEALALVDYFIEDMQHLKKLAKTRKCSDYVLNRTVEILDDSRNVLFLQDF